MKTEVQVLQHGLQFKKLLVCLDGTPESAVALPLARAVANSTHAKLALLRVVSPVAHHHDATRAEAKMYLTRIVDELQKGGVDAASMATWADDPADEIVKMVGELRADLIVMATHGRSGLARALRGSVTERVLAESSVPVLLLRPGGRRVTQIQTLLVPIDGTPGAARALEAATALAHATGARIALLQVAVPFTYVYGSDPLVPDPTWEEETQANAEAYVQDQVRRLRGAGLVAEGFTALGRPAEQICETARNLSADLVVMSTHALTGPARTLLGSVADEVVRTADCPVLLKRQLPRHKE